MTDPIAVVGMACLYPDARSPGELWENVLAQRRAFRRLPAERLRLDDYFSPDPTAPDRTYATEAAVIEGYEFDRVAFRVAGATYRAADLTHWLALDVAARALGDSHFEGGRGLPRETTGVFVGNTLTGEFSRANVMRLRWPYVRRVMDAALGDEGWSGERRRAFLGELESRYKAPFPAAGEETLAGGLSNTIAGRICNHFGLRGGGYTVDGACASSLLAVAQACTALSTGDLDAALAGGVDLSIDPFELVGFARAGALAAEEMRVYDARSAGFWPGEGCGMVVLMRLADAIEQRRPVAALVRGWGISSDGQGGITRPEVEGQILALRRAYRRAGFGIETVGYFEGHGTGTGVGDATELRALSRARRQSAPSAPPAVVGSVKANIGHTKAAAGVAGLINAAMALRAQIMPPTAGSRETHPELTGDRPALRVLGEGEPWPVGLPLRAGVSAMGFGGINAHVVLEGQTAERRTVLRPSERDLLSSAQDAELVLLDAEGAEHLGARVDRLESLAGRISRAELSDLAAGLERCLGGGGVRAAVVASSPAELVSRLRTLRDWLDAGKSTGIDPRAGVFLGRASGPTRIGFLFPGQGSPARGDGGALRRRFGCVRSLYSHADLPASGDLDSTAVAQPAIVTASVAGLGVLTCLGVEARVAVGHSLGEMTALFWAGALEEDSLLRVAVARGRAVADNAGAVGAMATLGLGPVEAEAFRDGEPVVIAGLNSPRQTVISGTDSGVDRVVARARAGGVTATLLPVAHPFHSPVMSGSVPALAGALARERLRPLCRAVVSTVTGSRLPTDVDLAELLCRQLTAPVRFTEALAEAGAGVDLWIEVGPGRVLSGLAADCSGTPVVALDAGGPSLVGLLCATGAAFVLGAPVESRALFAGRFTRPFDFERSPRFFANPCELAPIGEDAGAAECPAPPIPSPEQPGGTAIEVVRNLVSARTELPPSALKDAHRLLSDLHLGSIAVGQLVVEAARRLGLPPPVAPTHYADATIAEVARAFDDLVRTGGPAPVVDPRRPPPGVAPWVRLFTVGLVERPRPGRAPVPGTGRWKVLAPPFHPLAGPLSRAGGRGGVVVCLPPDPDERHVSLLLEGARAVLSSGGAEPFVLVQEGAGGAAFAKSLHLEAPGVVACVVDVPFDHPRAVDWVTGEAEVATGYSEVHYDRSGRRREPFLRALSVETLPASQALGPADVVLVSGGGKGIAAECALALAHESGASLGLLGRSRPAEDGELAANLRRMEAAGLRFRYVEADVTDADAVRSAVARVEASLGLVTALFHGAGVNEPRRLADLDEAAFRRTLAPKLRGARNLLDALDRDRLRLFVGFGSLIARTGMRGEADYAVANEWLARLAGRLQGERPACRCLVVEWSVWSGVGMGERLGRIDALVREGITPITPGEGVALMRDLVGHALPTVAAVATSRFGETPTLRLEPQALPFLRFLERPRVHYPGVELVVDAELSVVSDPYLDDHTFRGERLLPAVMGLEAMAQAAGAVSGETRPPIFEDVRFDRPVSIPDGPGASIRLAALVRGPGRVDVVLRSEATSFQVDHFRATCRFRGGDAETVGPPVVDLGSVDPEAGVAVDPASDLYGTILFQRGRFHRLQGYRRLRATECSATIAPAGTNAWFGRYLPPDFLLGDPGARDAAVHAVQACIPHVTLLPIGVERVIPEASTISGPLVVNARERSRSGDTFTYDLEITGADGRVRERWQGLRLHAVGGTDFRGPWAVLLLGPHIERRVRDVVPGAVVSAVVERDPGGPRRERTRRTLRRLLGPDASVSWRPDGRPEVSRDLEVSVSHSGDLTLAVAGRGRLGCDIESVTPRPASAWRDLLGPERFELGRVIGREVGEDSDASATRVWSAGECLEKAGASIDSPLTLLSSQADGWVVLAAGSLTVPTFVGPVRGAGHLLRSPWGWAWNDHEIIRVQARGRVRGDEPGRERLLRQSPALAGSLPGTLPPGPRQVLGQLASGLSLVTLRCSCEYLAELTAFDEVVIRMRLGALTQNRVTLLFEYWRPANSELVASGEQQVACMRREGGRLVPAPLPQGLREALQLYSSAESHAT